MREKRNEMKDAYGMYLDKIGKIPLLTIEEEKEYGKDLLLINDINIIDCSYSNGLNKYSLNLGKIFLSFIECNNYNQLLDVLIDYYGEKEADKKVLDQLIKYKRISKKFNRVLTKEEIKENFSINIEIIEALDEKELNTNISNLLKYFRSYYKFVNSNLRLVVSVAKRLNIDNNYNILDLIQSGNIGLMRAIQKFDIRKERRFSTYATWWIVQEIKRHIIKLQPIRLPDKVYNEMIKLKSELIILQKQHNFELTLDELAEKLNVSISELADAFLLCNTPMSIEEMVNEDNNIALKDIIADDYDLEEEAMKRFLFSDLSTIFESLSEKERTILECYHGIGGKEHHTLTQLGEMYHLSKERIRQIREVAEAKVKSNTEIREYIR